jgi:cytochrome c biogenesis protein CcmG/thiol:disulfide interchange protein DsbE
MENFMTTSTRVRAPRFVLPSAITSVPARLLLGSVLALGAASCSGTEGATDASSDAKSGLIGSPAPAFSAEFVTGDGPKSLDEAKGKVVILDFWATFCEPCKKSFPKYQELADQFKGDLTILAVSVDEADSAKKEDLVKFAKDTGVKFAVVWDKDHKVADRYKPPKMPSSYIIDKQGVVQHLHAGYEAGEETKIAGEVKALLAK